jgi:signal transduction histidine kinase
MLLEVLDVATGIVFLALGVIVWRRSRLYAALSVTAGVLWFAGDLNSALVLLHRPLVVGAILVSVAGRFPLLPAGVVVAALGAQAMIADVGQPWVSVVLAAALLVLAGSLHRVGSGNTRRQGARLALASMAAALVVPPVVRAMAGSQTAAYPLATYTGLVVLAGVALLGAEYRANTRELYSIIELSDRTPDQARQALRDLVGPQHGKRSRSGPEQALRLLELNAGLQADLECRLEEVRASRSRLLEAATQERRRLERTLNQRVFSYLDQLQAVVRAISAGQSVRTRELGAACVREADAAKDEMAQLARGLHPRTLTERGLAAALEELAGHATLPVRVHAPATRFPQPVETALWYACAEALTNAIKHSGATGASLSVEQEEGHVIARISDDGVGGAWLVPGGGLAGLADRLASVNGLLHVEAGRNGGTDVSIQVPVS